MSVHSMNRRIATHASLAKWAILGRQLRAVSQQTVHNWLPVKQMITATTPILQENWDEARRLLAISNQYFAPLKDPFETDLGLHRWLSRDREEAYSDWLAWIIEQLKTPDKIIPLFCGETASDLVKQCAGPIRVLRETVFVAAGSVRRTDIEICFGYKRAILVEVKMVEADKVTEAQLYDEAHYGADFEKRLLLVSSGEVDTTSVRFDLIQWRDVCLRLRRLVPSLVKDNISIAGMVLGFLGAIEQNVLNLPPQHEWYVVTSSTVDYLKQSLEKDIANA